ncbi:hypothetical protein ACFQX6_55370 [Streptosporangium lutulentum]
MKTLVDELISTTMLATTRNFACCSIAPPSMCPLNAAQRRTTLLG